MKHEKAHRWRVRFKRKDGYYTFREWRCVEKISQDVIEGLADTLLLGVDELESIDEIYEVDTGLR